MTLYFTMSLENLRKFLIIAFKHELQKKLELNLAYHV